VSAHFSKAHIKWQSYIMAISAWPVRRQTNRCQRIGEWSVGDGVGMGFVCWRTSNPCFLCV